MGNRFIVVVPLLLFGCAGEVGVDVRFADPEVGARAGLVVVELFGGSCASPTLCDGAPCARWTARARAQPTGAGASIPDGAGCVVATAYTGDVEEASALLARGESPIERPLTDRVEVVLRSPRVDRVAPGRGHTCASVEGVGVYCWGYNLSGEAGNGEPSDVARPARVELPRGQVIALAAGGYPGLNQNGHTCAVVERADDSQRELYCWGNNDDGQLGDGTTTSRPRPVRAAIPSEELTGTVTLSAGAAHTCLAASRGGEFSWRCWGRNTEGQLGLGHTDSPVPSPPPGSSERELSRVFTGDLHTCGTNAVQRLHCWGDGRSGQTGGSLAIDPTIGPPRLNGVGAIAVGAWHTCAVVGSGVQCFGSNDCGQIDIRNERDCSYTPVKDMAILAPSDGAVVDLPLEAGERVDELASAGAFTCALLSAGRVYCWGNGTLGQLGIGEAGTPRGAGFVVDEAGERLEGVTDVVAGEGAHACAIADGALYCWGRNHHNRVQPDGIDCRGGVMPDCNQVFAGRVRLP